MGWPATEVYYTVSGGAGGKKRGLWEEWEDVDDVEAQPMLPQATGEGHPELSYKLDSSVYYIPAGVLAQLDQTVILIDSHS